jgi:molybdate transport system ATP-binding protein
MIAVDVAWARGDFALRAAFESKARALAFYGPSGAGKSTLAMLIAGLLDPDAGRIAFAGETLVDTARGVCVPPERRRIAVVFQDALLFPHMSVRRNILFGRAFAPKDARRLDVDEVVGRLGIGALLERRPGALSGGEKQRVGIARALLAAPRLLVLDEPTASLDAARRREIMALIETLRDAFATPILLVSHAAEEIQRLAEDVVVIDKGQVVARGAPAETLPGAARRISGGRFALTSALHSNFIAFDPRYGVTRLAHPAGEIVVAARLAETAEPIRVEIKATDVALARDWPEGMSLRTALRGVVNALDVNNDALAFATLELAGGERLVASITRLAIDAMGLKQGDAVYALVKSVALDEREM